MLVPIAMASDDSDSESPADAGAGSSPDPLATSAEESASRSPAGTADDSDDSASDRSSGPASGRSSSEPASGAGHGSNVEDSDASVADESSSEPEAATASGSASDDVADDSSSAGSDGGQPDAPGSPHSPESAGSPDSAASPPSGEFCLWEICCAPDSELVAMVQRKGGEARRLTLETGFDMQCPRASRRAGRRIKETSKFARGWASPPCTKWSSMQNLTLKTPARAQALKQARRKSRVLVGHCVDLLITILLRKGHFYYEWPHHCQGWQIPELRRLRKAARTAGQEVFEVLFEGCAFGLRDSSGEFFLRKRWRVLTNDPGLSAVARQCPFQGRDGPGHRHTTIQGKETARSAFYPPRMCKVLAEHWRQHNCAHGGCDRGDSSSS